MRTDYFGLPAIDVVANAIQFWATRRDNATVADAAAAFNADPRMVIAAVDWHYAMFLSGPRDDYSKLIIEHEGEGE